MRIFKCIEEKYQYRATVSIAGVAEGEFPKKLVLLVQVNSLFESHVKSRSWIKGTTVKDYCF
jgi:hypothetical protein